MMSSETVTPDLLTKFEKLLELEERAATPGEAEAAAAAMTRLLTRYNLEALEVHQRLGTQGPKIAMVKEWVEVLAAGWRKSLLWAVSRHNFTSFVYYRRGGYLIGTPANIATTKRLYATLLVTVEHLADLGWGKHKDGASDSATVWKNAFRLGAVSGIGDAMRRARSEVVDATEGGSALVLVNAEELRAATLHFVGVTTTGKGSSISNGSAYSAGYQAGRTVNVSAAGSLKGGGR